MKLKAIIILVLGSLLSAQLNAQTFSEWFKQNKTQLKYLHQQIAALIAYEKVVEKGYAIIKTGTDVISNIKRGDLSLHSSYFSSLTAVKPEVLLFTGRLDAEWANDKIGVLAKSTKDEAGQSGVCTAGEIEKIKAFFSSLQRSAQEQWTAFSQVNSNGGLQMTDAERMSRSENLSRGLMEQYRAALTYSQAVHVLCQGRLQELYDAKSAENLYNNK